MKMLSIIIYLLTILTGVNTFANEEQLFTNCEDVYRQQAKGFITPAFIYGASALGGAILTGGASVAIEAAVGIGTTVVTGNALKETIKEGREYKPVSAYNLIYEVKHNEHGPAVSFMQRKLAQTGLSFSLDDILEAVYLSIIEGKICPKKYNENEIQEQLRVYQANNGIVVERKKRDIISAVYSNTSEGKAKAIASYKKFDKQIKSTLTTVKYNDIKQAIIEQLVK